MEFNEIDIIEKLLIAGASEMVVKPSATFLKDLFSKYSDQMKKNLYNIFKNATEKLENHPEKQGAISERVLNDIIKEGAFIEDKIAQLYFAGVLAGSKSDSEKRDDRGIFYSSLIKQMSSYQLRTHYIIYHIVKRLCDDNGMCIGGKEYRGQLEVFIPYTVYCEAMEFNRFEMQRLDTIIQQTIWGLETYNMILNDSLFHNGVKRHRNNYYTFRDTTIPDGFLIRPSTQGVQLFYWASGQPDLILNNFLKPEYKFNLESNIVINPGSELVVK